MANHDCQLFGAVIPAKYAADVMQEIEPEVFTQQDLQVAVTWLKSACCQQGLIAEQNCTDE